MSDHRPRPTDRLPCAGRPLARPTCDPGGSGASSRPWLAHLAVLVRLVRLLGLTLVLASLLPAARAQTPPASPASPTPAAAPHRVPDTLDQRLRACTGCHGPQGKATPEGFVPRLAGKPADYLFRQLQHFRDGTRAHALMAGLLGGLGDGYLREIAAHFAAQQLAYPPPPPAVGSAAVLARGRQLALQGDAARRLPACASCHGEALTGRSPALPGLLGLPREYLVLQLGSWRHGVRRAQAPDCMAEIAQRLGEADTAAVAAWLAAQPVPADARPAPPAAEPPLACGSAGPVAAAVTMAASTPTPTPTPVAVPKPVAAKPAAAVAAEPPPGGPDPSLRPADDPAARGAYLARVGHCAGCHTTPGGAPYAGGRGIVTPFGTVFAGNLTPDATGLAGWTADDFWQALHHGRGRDGRRLVPAFPYTEYTRTTRADSDALFAYLRSLPPVRQPNRPHALRFPFGSQPALAAWQWLNFRPGGFEPDARRSAEWNRGAYLVQGLGHCAACHAGRNWLGAPRDGGRAPAGGLIPQQGWYAPSLLAAEEAGVAHWSIDEVVALLKTGQSRHGVATGPMAEVVVGSTQHWRDADLRAAALYLQSLASPTPSPVARFKPAPDEQLVEGAAVYRRQCSDCHGPAGQGVPGAVPPLAGNRVLTMTPPVNAVRMVLHGGFAPATAANPRPHGMPPLALPDAEVAAVLTWLRQQWGHRAPPVTAMQVQQAREAGR